jgi:hypothetical protein
VTAAQIISQALGGYRIAKDEYRCRCPAHSDRDPSLDVRDTRDGRVLVVCRVGCAQIDVIHALMDLKLWPECVGYDRVSHTDTEADLVQARRMQAMALRIFEEAVDPRYTLAEFYMAERGLTLPISADVRFHARCPRRRSGVAPALVVLMRNYLTNKPQAIQRIYINPKTATKDRCEASPKGTLMLGPADGAAMMLTNWSDTFADVLSFAPRLFVCEGFETACALMQRGRSPTWALGDAGRIGRLPVLFGVGQLVICADHDRVNEKTGKRAGLAAAVECRARWNATSHQSASIITVNNEGEDYADWGKQHGEAERAAV